MSDSRPLGDVLTLLDWGRAAGVAYIKIGDVSVSWPVVAGMGAHLYAEAVPRGADPGAGNIVPLRKPGRSKGITESVAMEEIAKDRAAKEAQLAASGAPEFREVEDILRAEEEAEKGYAPIAARDQDDPAVSGKE